MVEVGLDNGLKDRLPKYDSFNDGMFKMAVSNILRQRLKKGFPVVIDGEIVTGITP